MAGVWDFGDADDIKPLEDSSDEEASRKDTQDELSLLPAHKRRKLQQLNRSRKQVELIDLDNEDNDGDENGSQGLYIVGKPSTKKAAESDSDLDLEYKPLVKRPPASTAPLDPVILQNQALLRSFREAAQEPIVEDLSPERAPPIIPRRPTAQPEPQIHTDSDSDNSSGSNDDAALPQADDNKIILKMQSRDGNLSLRIGRQLALSKLFEIYKQQAIQKGWLPPEKASSVRFVFDGDNLSGNETVEGLDCDNGDIIEVKW
ncbi:TPA: hypothetical protein ACH3X2_004704 [Trebouxia sp. C0005]